MARHGSGHEPRPHQSRGTFSDSLFIHGDPPQETIPIPTRAWQDHDGNPVPAGIYRARIFAGDDESYGDIQIIR
ncbi:MAG: hypothetical protein KAY24_14065 [Candidatus Eisenbacteria sp.]|nr:hypothetical protein [Candidatus Eisenbacteria bacterium]